MLLFMLSSCFFNPITHWPHTGLALLLEEHLSFRLVHLIASLQISIGPDLADHLTCSSDPSWSVSVTSFASSSLFSISLHPWVGRDICHPLWNICLGAFPSVSVTFRRSCLGTSANLHVFLVLESYRNQDMVRGVLRPLQTRLVMLSFPPLHWPSLSYSFCSVSGQHMVL